MADFEVFNGLEIQGSPATHSRYISAIFAKGGKFHYREDNGEVIVVYGIPEDDAPQPEAKLEKAAELIKEYNEEVAAVEAPVEEEVVIPAPPALEVDVDGNPAEEAPVVEEVKPAPVKRGRKPAVKAEVAEEA